MNSHYYRSLLIISSLLSIEATSMAQPGPVDQLTADRSASLLTYSLRTGTQSRGGTNRDVTASATYDAATQRLDQLRVQAKINAFTDGVPTDDAHAIRRLNGAVHPDLEFVSERIDYETDESLMLTGTLLFHGVRSPVRLRASQAVGDRQLIVESVFPVDPTAHHLRPVSLTAGRSNRVLRIAFMLVMPLPAPPAPALLSQQSTRP